VQRAHETDRAAGSVGLTVVHAPLRIDPDSKEGWLATLTFGHVFTAGTEKAEFTPGIYDEGDLVAEGRYAFDAFAGSDLAEILEGRDVRTVFLGGFTTDQCVARSVRTALDRGYDASVLTALTATYSALPQRRTERRIGIVPSSRLLTGGPGSAERHDGVADGE
jgi:nicotinamidase-related amidase